MIKTSLSQYYSYHYIFYYQQFRLALDNFNSVNISKVFAINKFRKFLKLDFLIEM